MASFSGEGAVSPVAGGVTVFLTAASHQGASKWTTPFFFVFGNAVDDVAVCVFWIMLYTVYEMSNRKRQKLVFGGLFFGFLLENSRKCPM